MNFEVRKRAVDRLGAALRSPIKTTAPEASQYHRLCPELDCLRGWLSASTVAMTERRAIMAGVGADRVLITAGVLDEEIYVRLLADSLGIVFEPLDDVGRADCPLDDELLMRAPATGALPLVIADEPRLVVAPRDFFARNIVNVVRSRPELAKRFRLTTAPRLRSFVARHAAHAIEAHAIRALATMRPEMSAGPPRWQMSRRSALLACAIGGAVLMVAPAAVRLGCDVILTALFLAWTVLRCGGILVEPPSPPRRSRIPDRNLPSYTVLAPLYRETASISGLIAALRRLDYPAEKLDIKLIVEPDDLETREALGRLELGPPFEVIVAPSGGPRTKPKALNAALPWARGSFTVIYDAEDRPEPSQLRDAVNVFLSRGRDLACVQASLTIDNTADNWLTAMFTAEYAGQFDVFLPALAHLRMPLPLGGSSNHFRTEVLHAVGAWDPYNVTEDADLGVRLARYGYRSAVIETATYEEAPAALGPWLRQRTRWFKGWMQTWLVHMRRPRALWRELGPSAFFATQLIIGGNVLGALVHPILIAWLIAVAAGLPAWESYVTAALFGTMMISGYLASAALGAVGLHRRGVSGHAWVLLLVPLHWLLLAIAAWRALYQLVKDPYRWEKTEHGLARTSRAQWHPNAAATLRKLATVGCTGPKLKPAGH